MPRKWDPKHRDRAPPPAKKPPSVFTDFFESGYDIGAAAQVAYESFVRELGLKIGQKVSDTSGVHRIGSWDQLKTFQKSRWRTLAQNVIDAATGKRSLTPLPKTDNDFGVRIRRRKRLKKER